MYTTTVISPQELYLDEQNPRFKIKVNPTQEDIIHYMFEHENVSFLAQKMVEMDTLLPGERVIVFNDGNKNIVLEGNRRTAIYKTFLDQTLIPYNYKKKFPIPFVREDELFRRTIDLWYPIHAYERGQAVKLFLS